MRVKAMTNIKYAGEWHAAGTVIDAKDDAEELILSGLAVPAEAAAPDEEKPKEETEKARPRTRRR